MYRKTGLYDVDEAHYEIFLETYKPKSDCLVLKKIDAGLMPARKKALVEKVKRAHFIARRLISAPYSSPHPDC